MDRPTKRICLTCHKEIIGRSDKRFCDAYCRNAYNNQIKKEQERIILAVNKQLRRNRSILKSFCPEGKGKVRRERLTDLGFSFPYFTSIYQSGKTVYHFCYEYGYAAIHERSSSTGQMVEKVLIIQHQDYMKGSFDPWKITLESI